MIFFQETGRAVLLLPSQKAFPHNLLMNFQSSQKDHFTSCLVIPVAKMKLQCLLPGGSVNMSTDSFTTG